MQHLLCRVRADGHKKRPSVFYGGLMVLTAGRPVVLMFPTLHYVYPRFIEYNYRTAHSTAISP